MLKFEMCERDEFLQHDFRRIDIPLPLLSEASTAYLDIRNILKEQI